ncbi:MAG: carbonic anhydrase [bacterium]
MDIVNYHHWDVLVMSCIDGRFIKRTVDWTTDQIGEVFDFRTGVGCSKAILQDKIDCKDFVNVVRTAISLHKIKEIWLVDHIDCGAYGGSERFCGDEAREKNFHIEKLGEAAEVVQSNFPELVVKKFYADWDNISVVS